MVRLLVLPSPLLPAIAYDGLAAALSRAGVPAEVAAVGTEAPPDAVRLVEAWASRASTDTVLLPHSNAGYLAPSVRHRAGGSAPVVFVDAALPPEVGATRLAPSRFRDHLEELAGAGGVLPPWTRWWPRAVLADVIPVHRFEELDRTCPRVPLSYFDGEVVPPPGWVDGPTGYLAFGDTYADELAFARARRWPTAVLEGGHLHFLHDPDAVAAAVLGLLDAVA